MGRVQYVIGVDEVGRGPLAGPLCVGACAVPFRSYGGTISFFAGVKDCKKLSPEKRLQWFSRIKNAETQGRLITEVSFVSEKVIDSRGITFALKTAIKRVLGRFAFSPAQCRILLDGGIAAPRSFAFQKTIIRGDETEPLIALASIVAKVRRDRRMTRLSESFPKYGFEIHKGYGTKAHYRALRRYGLCKAHRRSFLKKFTAASVGRSTGRAGFLKSDSVPRLMPLRKPSQFAIGSGCRTAGWRRGAAVYSERLDSRSFSVLAFS